MVQLGDDGHTASGQALHHDHLPQGPVELERPAHHVRHQLVELAGPARCREAHTAEMVVELELGVVDPHGVVKPERDPDGTLAQLGHQVQPLLDRPSDLGVAG